MQCFMIAGHRQWRERNGVSPSFDVYDILGPLWRGGKVNGI